MKQIIMRWWAVPVCTLLAALLMHSGSIVRYSDTSSEKVPALVSGPRTEIADNYFYYTLLRHARERFDASATDLLDSDGGDHRHINSISNTYASALYAGHLLYKISALITSNARETLLITAFFHTWILATCIVVFALTLLNKKEEYTPIFIFLLAIVSMVGVDAFSISIYFGFPYWNKSLLINEPNPLRLINPTLFWSVGLLAASLIVRWLREGSNIYLLLSIGTTFLCSLFSISVGTVLLGAIGLSIVINFFKLKNISWGLIVIFFVSLIGLIWTFLQLVEYANTPLGQELRHGEFNNFIFKWHFLIFLIFIPLLNKRVMHDKGFVASLFFVSIFIGSICDSFNLGSRLWLRGGAIFVWTITLYLMLKAIYSLKIKLNFTARYFLKSTLILVVSVFVLHSQYRGPSSWVGFILKDKADLYDWMDVNINPNTIVASEDLEDAFLIPVYTNSKSLFSSIGMTNRILDDEIRRYFFAMSLYGSDIKVLKEITEVVESDMVEYYNHIFSKASPNRYSGEKADAVIFLRNVIYIPYIKRFSNILNGQDRHDIFVSNINQLAFEGRNSNFRFEYSILKKNMHRPVLFLGWRTIYSNDTYELLVNPKYDL